MPRHKSSIIEKNGTAHVEGMTEVGRVYLINSRSFASFLWNVVLTLGIDHDFFPGS